MRYRPSVGVSLSHAVRVLVMVAVLALGLASSARAEVVRRYWDDKGTLISITKMGNLIEFFTNRNTATAGEHIFSGNVQEGYLVTYGTSSKAYNVDDDSWNLNPGTVTGTATGYYPSTAVPLNPIEATVTTTTWDGKLRIKSKFTWTPGTKQVQIDTWFVNISSSTVTFKTAKRFVDANVNRKLINDFNTDFPTRAWAQDPATGRRFTLKIVDGGISPVAPGVDFYAYHVDFVDHDFSIPGDGNAELGSQTGVNDALVGFLRLTQLGGGGYAAAPNGALKLRVKYKVEDP